MVGGGVIGLACAWLAAEAGAEVAVIDAGPERPAAATVAAGMIAPVGEASWGEEALLSAAIASAASWPAFAERLEAAAGLSVPYRRCGAVHVALDRDEAEELRRRAALLGRLGLDHRPLTPSEARGLEPGLAPGVVAGLLAEGEAEVDPRALLAALEAAARTAGVRLVAATVESVLIEGDAVRGVRLADGIEIAAASVLVAAGAWSAAELLPAELRPPVRPVKGQILRLRAAPDSLPCERIVASERVYVVSRASGEVVVGATVEERGFDTTVTAGGVHELLREAYRALPEIAELELVETAAGLRPGTPDNAPIVGAGGPGGLLLATGMYRNGILLAPLVAEAIARILAGAAPAAELRPFDPGRFRSSPKVAA